MHWLSLAIHFCHIVKFRALGARPELTCRKKDDDPGRRRAASHLAAVRREGGL
jgi:hypothetical protein